jgi:ABC-2 type transport system permease protein
MQLYLRIARFNFGTYLAYPFELVAAALRPVIDFGFVLLFWSIVAASSAGSVNFRKIAAYFLIATAVNNLVFLSGIKFGSVLAKAVKYGDISNFLIKPVNVLHDYLATMIGNMGVTYAVSGIFLLLGLVLQPPASLLACLLFFAYLPLALIISYSINVLVGTVAFYFTEASSIKNVTNHIVSVFSGAWVPLSFFPGTLRTIVSFLPFQAAVFGPTQALQTTSLNSTAVTAIAVSTGWAIVLYAVAMIAWRKGIKHYEAVGI